MTEDLDEFIASLEEEIKRKYKERGDTMGWRLFSCPKAALKNPRVVFMGQNPGGSHVDKSHGEITTEKGSAYVVESWPKKDHKSKKPHKYYPAGESPLQVQVQRLFEMIGEEPAEVLSGNLVPFRSPSWEELDNKDDALEFGRAIWGRVFRRINPDAVITIGAKAREAVWDMQGVETDDTYRFWLRCTGYKGYEKHKPGRPVYVGLPLLSRFKIFSNQDSIRPLQELLKECM